MLLDMRCAEFQRTDMGNAERWFARFGRDYLYTTAKGWLGWDGRRYRVLNQEKEVTPAEVTSSEETTSELQSLMSNSYAVFCLKPKNTLAPPQDIRTIKSQHNQT